jgi:hypothetical protein
LLSTRTCSQVWPCTSDETQLLREWQSPGYQHRSISQQSHADGVSHHMCLNEVAQTRRCNSRTDPTCRTSQAQRNLLQPQQSAAAASVQQHSWQHRPHAQPLNPGDAVAQGRCCLCDFHRSFATWHTYSTKSFAVCCVQAYCHTAKTPSPESNVYTSQLVLQTSMHKHNKHLDRSPEPQQTPEVLQDSSGQRSPSIKQPLLCGYRQHPRTATRCWKGTATRPKPVCTLQDALSDSNVLLNIHTILRTLVMCK